MAEDVEGTGRLLTASCTTGWGDWIHGELWLLPDGLLRIRLGLLQTIGHGVWPTVSLKRVKTRQFDATSFAALIAQRRNLWIPREQIQSASLTAVSLHLDLVGAHPVTLLWAPVDPAFQPLRAVLGEWMGRDVAT